MEKERAYKRIEERIKIHTVVFRFLLNALLLLCRNGYFVGEHNAVSIRLVYYTRAVYQLGSGSG